MPSLAEGNRWSERGAEVTERMANATGSQVAFWRTSTIRELRRTTTIDVPTQNAEPWNHCQSKEVAVYSSYDQIDHSMEEMNKMINEKVMEVTILKNGQLDLSLYGDHKHLYIQPSCKFTIGGVQGDADLDEREAHHLCARQVPRA